MPRKTSGGRRNIFNRRVQAPSKVRRDIQGLRMVAVGAVILDHLFAWPSGGFVGVDMFFVISGFLITGLLLREWERTGTISFKDFYRRRVRRILPAAAATLAATVVAANYVFSEARAASTFQDALGGLLFYSNWRFAAAGTDYFQAAGPVSPLQHFWSLSVEEQFYFVWPWIMLLVLTAAARFAQGRAGRPRVVVGSAMGIIVVATFAWSLYQTATEPTVAYFSTLTRAWELGLGALLATCVGPLARLPRAVRPVLAWLGVIGLVASLFVIDNAMPFPAPWALLPVLSTVLVIAANSGTSEQARVLWPLTNPVSVYVGNISYSLYLWHFPIVIFGAALFPATVSYFVVALVAMLLIAAWSYHFIEYPLMKSSLLEPLQRGESSFTRLKAWFLQHKRRLQVGGFSLLVPLTALSVFVALLPAPAPSTALSEDGSASAEGPGATAPPTGGAGAADDAMRNEVIKALSATEWPELHPTIDELGLDVVASEWAKDNCLQNFKPDAHACTFGPDDAHRRAIVLGDSVAISWVPAIRAALGDGWRIDVWTMTQCPAALVSVKATDGTPYAKCDDFHTKTTADLAAATADLVFLGQASNTSDRIVPSDGVSGKEALTEGLAQRVRDIAAHVGHVVVLGSNVEMSKALTECYTRVSKPNDCAMAVPGTHAAIAAAEEASIEGVVNAQFVSPDPWMCHQNKCPVFVGSNVVLADKLHFTDAYSRAIGPALGEVLRAGGSLE